MALQVYNTLTRGKEEFTPFEPEHVKLYVCGITAYDYCHIGHARSAIVFDVIYRYLLHLGFRVTYVRNFTDIDDKIINRANDEGCDYRAVADKYIDAFHQDMRALDVLPPTMEPLATQNIQQMIDIIQRLMNKGIAYQADPGSDVYFAVERFSEYGRLSGRMLEDMLAGARVDVDEHKRNPLDFVLWKAGKPGEPAWESPWGRGRPGWHIECSAMGNRYLGNTFDIHGGGKDLVFPHHENEKAQSEAAFDAPFVRYWLHNGFVNINNEKMSKSLGNFFTIRDVLQQVHPEALRLFVLSKHYRSPVDFTEETIADAERGLEKLYGTLAAAQDRLPQPTDEFPDKALQAQDQELHEAVTQLPQLFAEAMNNDFNSAQAIGHLFGVQRHLQRFLDRFGMKKLKGPAAALAAKGAAALRQNSQILGLLGREPHTFFEEQKRLKIKTTGLSAEEVEQLIQMRQNARQAKNFAEADRIRSELESKGVQLEDSPQGTRWRVSI
jgi:cysteinyl-tRNA synthetase